LRRVPISPKRVRNAFRTYWLNFRRRGEPVVISFPKSGRTWLRLMLEEANIPVRYDHAGSDHTSRRTKNDLDIGMAPRAKTRVLLIRDPRDTVVSGYYQAARRLHMYSGSISDFIRDPRHGIEKVINFNLMWLKQLQSDPDAMILSYEKLAGDTELGLHKVSEFLGHKLPIEMTRRIVVNNRFSAMQARERQGEFESFGQALTPGDPEDVTTYKVRRGKIGGYLDELSRDDVAYCNEQLEKASYFTVVDGQGTKPDRTGGASTV